MIFAATFHQVLRGAKTQTRRPMVPYPLELPKRPPPGIGHHPGPPSWPRKAHAFDAEWRALSYRPGDVRAVQPGRGKEALGYITIQDVTPSTLYAITDEDAQAEGFKDRAAFAHAWVGLHDRPWVEATERLLARLPCLPEDIEALATALDLTDRTLLRRLRYLQAAGAAAVRDTDDAWTRVDHAERIARQHRFFDRHALRPVWVITFELVQDTTVMLAARPPRATTRKEGDRPVTNEEAASLENRGYTLSPFQAAVEEHPEVVGRTTPVVAPVVAVDPAELDAMTKDARTASRIRIEHETRNDRQALVDAINALQARDDIGEAAAKRLANMKRELARVDAELKAA